MRFFYILCLCVFSLFATDSKINVLVSVLPQKEFIQRIGGEHIVLDVLVPPGKSPEFYEPSIAQMRHIQHAQVFFGVGLGLESKWAQRFQSSNASLRYYNLAQEVDKNKQEIYTKNAHMHNPHIWLSLENSKKYALFITHTLSELQPKYKADFEHNLHILLGDIQNIQDRVKLLFQNKNAQKSFLVYHPAFELFAQEFGLEELSIEVDGKEVKGRALSVLETEIKNKKLRTLFFQPQFSRTRVEGMARGFNVNLIALNPLREDWLHAFRIYACQIAFDLKEEEVQECVQEYFKGQL